MLSRPALLPADGHPLSYTSGEECWSAPKASLKAQAVEEKVEYLMQSQRLRDLLSQFSYSLDACLVNPATLDFYTSLFTEDCQLVFPFGTFHGKIGIPEMVLKAESRFQRMTVSLVAVQARRWPAYSSWISASVITAYSDVLLSSISRQT